MKNLRAIGTVFAASLVFVGCSGEEGGANDTGSSSTSAPKSATATWKLTAMPDGAVDVGAVKKDAKEGDTVVIRGRIGGGMSPISDELAVFTIVDPAIVSCADMGEDHCRTPWDYCCEPQDSMTANNATIQILGDDGFALPVNLTEFGIEPLDEVIVIGTVGPRPESAVLMIKADGVFEVEG